MPRIKEHQRQSIQRRVPLSAVAKFDEVARVRRVFHLVHFDFADDHVGFEDGAVVE